MKIYNSLTRRKEDFVPLEQGKVKMYACGITVSGEAHIGHLYQALIYDIMRKFLEKEGYKVTYARNYTDIDDKIIARSNETGIAASVFAEQMIDVINAEMKAYKIDDPTLWLKATQNVDNIISFVQKLIDKGCAYVTSKGDVYFRVSSFKGYGKLSGRRAEEQLSGVRVDNDDEKEQPLDFALWKAAKPGEPFWQSPWSNGRPGWHIECSVMNYVAFGEQIDIHGGGRDLLFPHHENEIAQTESLTGKPFAKYWTHNGLIRVDGQKMSKSLGNSLLMRDLRQKYHIESIKYALLQNSYHSDINVTDALFEEAQEHLRQFYEVILSAQNTGALQGENAEVEQFFDEAMRDDFNTAKALGGLFKFFKDTKTALSCGKGEEARATVANIIKTYRLLGLFKESAEEFLQATEAQVPSEVKKLANERWQAKQDKDYAKADSLRKEIEALGYLVKDTKTDYTLLKK